MKYAVQWQDLLYELQALTPGSAKRQFRHMIRQSWGGLCAYCRSSRGSTCDHIKPRSKGGDSLRSNLLPCCPNCQQSKGSREWREWFTEQEFYSPVVEELILEWMLKQPPATHVPELDHGTDLEPAFQPCTG